MKFTIQYQQPNITNKRGKIEIVCYAPIYCLPTNYINLNIRWNHGRQTHFISSEKRCKTIKQPVLKTSCGKLTIVAINKTWL